MSRWVCRLRGHRLRFGVFDRAVLAHDVFCARCGGSATARELSADLDGFELTQKEPGQ